MAHCATAVQAALAAGLVLGSAGVAVGGAAPAYGAVGRCAKGTGVTVVVDYGSLGGSTRIACDSNGGGQTASGVFSDTGFPLTRVAQFPGAVCRVSGLPGAATDSCVRMPPADAYWGLFWSDGDPATWVYSTVGVDGLKVPKGGSLAWRWQDSTTRKLPRVLPNALPTGAAAANASPTPSPTPSPTRKPSPTPSSPKPSPSKPAPESGPTNPATRSPGDPSASASSGGSGSSGASTSADGAGSTAPPSSPSSRSSQGGDGAGQHSATGTPGHRRSADANREGGPGSENSPGPGAAASDSGRDDAARAGAGPVTEVTTPVSASSSQGALTWVAVALGVGLLAAAGALAWRRRQETSGR